LTEKGFIDSRQCRKTMASNGWSTMTGYGETNSVTKSQTSYALIRVTLVLQIFDIPNVHDRLSSIYSTSGIAGGPRVSARTTCILLCNFLLSQARPRPRPLPVLLPLLPLPLKCGFKIRRSKNFSSPPACASSKGKNFPLSLV